MNHHWQSGTATILAACAIAGTVTCNRASEQLLAPPAQAPLATPQCLGRSSPDYFFGPGQISELNDASESFLRQSWFHAYLAAAGADSLSCGGPQEAYRLLWLPAFRNAKIFTIKRVESAWQLEIVDFGKELFAGVGPSPPPRLARATRDIGPSELRRIQQELELFNFWSARQYRSDPGGTDGYALVIEGRSGDKYRATTRINLWDGAEQVACPLFDIARIMLPDAIRCVRPVSMP
jgi:hypothetical protein